MDMGNSEISDPVDPNDDALDKFNESRFGAGVRVSNLTIEYAWQNVEDLGSVHRIGVSFRR